MERSWQQNADEYGAIERGDNAWLLAIRVACSVRYQGNGRPKKLPTLEVSTGKVTAVEFADRAGVSHASVSSYLAQWDTAAKAVGLPMAADLTPDQVDTITIPSQPFNGSAGVVRTRVGGPNSSAEVAKSPGALANALDEATPEVLEEALSRVSKTGKVLRLAAAAGSESRTRMELDSLDHGGDISMPKDLLDKSSPVDPIAAMLEQWAHIVDALTEATQLLDDFGTVSGPQGEQLRGFAMKLMDYVLDGRLA